MDQQPRATTPNQQSASNQSTSKHQIAIIVLLAGLLAVTCFGAFSGSPTGKTKWDYNIVAVPDMEFDETMAKLGGDGRELVLGRRARDSADDMMYECVFKRPR